MRAQIWNIEILGIETDLDSDVPFHVFVWEDFFTEDDSPTWCLKALESFFEEYPKTVLKFTINIPEDRIEEISKAAGLSI